MSRIVVEVRMYVSVDLDAIRKDFPRVFEEGRTDAEVAEDWVGGASGAEVDNTITIESVLSVKALTA